MRYLHSNPNIWGTFDARDGHARGTFSGLCMDEITRIRRTYFTPSGTVTDMHVLFIP